MFLPILMCVLLIAIVAMLIFISYQIADGVEQLEKLNKRYEEKSGE